MMAYEGNFADMSRELQFDEVRNKMKELSSIDITQKDIDFLDNLHARIRQEENPPLEDINLDLLLMQLKYESVQQTKNSEKLVLVRRNKKDYTAGYV
ncbi:hypothetical protein [Clostridium lacusfryxellense]|uniref:hypothetical protein n=1 Tax=Clostridium lacusfryxellense TaxID=205328 RepID=UPI001C0C777A|nr:hypothetical protein [Clostridium lacusfryxellense]MBU3112711.1 hypothetical protein [Clostridium lacusfryxellense]